MAADAQPNRTLVVNLYGGPGTGKSTTAAAVFAELKQRGVNAELVTEYAKDKVWDEHMRIFENPYYVFGKQLQRQLRLEGKVDVLITDSPVLLSIVHNRRRPAFNDVVFSEFEQFRNINFFLVRTKPYVKIGRYEDENGARELDKRMKEMLDHYKIGYETIPCERAAIAHIVGRVEVELARGVNHEGERVAAPAR